MKFQQKILNCRVIGARQIFQIFRQNTWFLESNRALSKFLYGILHYLIRIIKYYQNKSIKNNFMSTTQATLKAKNYWINWLTIKVAVSEKQIEIH